MIWLMKQLILFSNSLSYWIEIYCMTLSREVTDQLWDLSYFEQNYGHLSPVLLHCCFKRIAYLNITISVLDILVHIHLNKGYIAVLLWDLHTSWTVHAARCTCILLVAQICRGLPRIFDCIHCFFVFLFSKVWVRIQCTECKYKSIQGLCCR